MVRFVLIVFVLVVLVFLLMTVLMIVREVTLVQTAVLIFTIFVLVCVQRGSHHSVSLGLVMFILVIVVLIVLGSLLVALTFGLVIFVVAVMCTLGRVTTAVLVVFPALLASGEIVLGGYNRNYDVIILILGLVVFLVLVVLLVFVVAVVMFVLAFRRASIFTAVAARALLSMTVVKVCSGGQRMRLIVVMMAVVRSFTATVLVFVSARRVATNWCCSRQIDLLHEQWTSDLLFIVLFQLVFDGLAIPQ